MKYMLMMHAPRGTGAWDMPGWSQSDVKAMVEFMHRFNADLKKSGEFVLAEGLEAPKSARLVKASEKGEPITDGPFAESKEYLAGFWIVDVASAERAYELAAQVSMSPGAGGKPGFIALEVRPVGVAPA